MWDWGGVVGGAGSGLRVVRSDDVGPASNDERPGWVTPFGYVIDSRGVWRIVDDETGDSEQVLTTPLWISGRMVDVETQECALRLRWVGWSGAVVDHVVDAVQVADSRAIMGLSARGPVPYTHTTLPTNHSVKMKTVGASFVINKQLHKKPSSMPVWRHSRCI